MIFKGYIFSRPFFGERAPQHIQNIILRDYCKKKKLDFELSNTEYSHSKSTKVLMNILDNIENYKGIIFYSLLQLPENTNQRFKLYKKIIKKKKEIHFALENRKISSKNEVEYTEKIFLLKKQNFYKKNDFMKLGKLKYLVSEKHYKVKRDYLGRVIDNKIECMKISKKYDLDYWDGDRKYGYGGYRYIPGYHKLLAQKIIKQYNLDNNSKILDVGCGKGFLLYEIKKILKDIKITGIDISKYAKKNAKAEIKKFVSLHDIRKKLKFTSANFDLVISINTLHNLKLPEICLALSEIERVGKSKFVCVESYRNEKEQFNLQCWALTAETIIDTSSWKWLFKKSNYSGDYEFIYFL